MADGAAVTVELAASVTPEVRTLIAELDADLAQHYSAEQRHGLALDAIFQPHIRFFVARREGVAVGCGGVALMDGFGEVKRMYVRARGARQRRRRRDHGAAGGGDAGKRAGSA